MTRLQTIQRNRDGLSFVYDDGTTMYLGFGYVADGAKETFVESIFELERRAKFFEPPPKWRPPVPRTLWQRIKAVFRP